MWETCGSGDGLGSHESGEHVVQAKAEVKGEKAGVVKDPVCGMDIGDIKKALSEEYHGKVYYFCSDQCKKTFKKTRHPIYPRNHHNMMRVKDTNINTQVPNALLTP